MTDRAAGWTALGLIAAAIAGFVVIVAAVGDGSDLLAADRAAHRALFEAFGASADAGRAVTWFGNHDTLVGAVTAVCVALLAARRPWDVVRVLAASGIGGPVSVGLKALFRRARPLETVIPAEGYSFPSGHAFASTVFYGVCVVLVWRLTERRGPRAAAAVVGATVVVAVGLSRVYLNVHYLTDVVAGWLAGAAWLTLSLLAVGAVERAVGAWSSGHR